MRIFRKHIRSSKDNVRILESILGKHVQDAINTIDKKITHEVVESAMEEFLSNGGEIEKIPNNF